MCWLVLFFGAGAVPADGLGMAGFSQLLSSEDPVFLSRHVVLGTVTSPLRGPCWSGPALPRLSCGGVFRA